MIKKSIFTIIIILNLAFSKWIARGDFSDSMMLSTINTQTSQRFVTAINGAKANQISAFLNSAFARFWNVVQLLPDQTKAIGDSALFGYAFNMHWHWSTSTTGFSVIYVIWKDYNCQVQVTQSMSSNFDNMVDTVSDASQIIDSYPNLALTNTDTNLHVWQRAVTLYDYLNGLYAGSYSVVMGEQIKDAYGSICTGQAVNQVTGATISNQSTYLVRYIPNAKANFILVMKMNQRYQDLSNGIKPTLTTLPSCLKKKHILSTSQIPLCTLSLFSSIQTNPSSIYQSYFQSTQVSASSTNTIKHTRGFNFYTPWIGKDYFPSGSISKFSFRAIVSASMAIQVGIITAPKINNFNTDFSANSDIILYDLSNGDVWQGTGFGLKSRAVLLNEVVDVTVDLINGKVKLQVGQQILTTITISTSIKAKNLHAYVLFYNNNDKIILSV